MSIIFQSIIVVLVGFIVGCIASDTTIGMKLLVLSTEEPLSVIRSLQSYAIEYDYLEYNNENPLVGDLPLYTEDHQPKYYGIVFGNSDLTVLHEDTQLWSSILTESQWAYLNEYQKKYGVRIVQLNPTWGTSILSPTLGTTCYDPNHWGVGSLQEMTMANNDLARSIFKEAGIKPTIPLNTQGLYHVPVKITDENIATPILNFQPNEDISGESSAVVYVKKEDGTERLLFFITFGDWSLNSWMLNHLWISWVTRSLYAGQRLVTFTPHIDDVFLSTSHINGPITPDNEKPYRSTVEDFQILEQWQKDVLKELPEGSHIQCELAYNGNGIIAAADPAQALIVDGNRYCDIEFKNPPGAGNDRWPEANYTLPFDKEFFEKDDLFAYFEKEENNKNFYFSSHTFTHENLDEATTSDADNEIRVNIEMARLLGIYDQSNFSSKSIITPQISGLRNVNVIDVLRKYGIESGTGDTSRPGLCNTENPYLPFYTTEESSNVAGFPIIPRSPTEVYFVSSNVEENTSIYNSMYNAIYGESTWDQIVERESNRVLNLMMELRNEAYQFHQINIRSHDLNDRQSLLQKWSHAVLKKYASYVDWPVISLKLDDQAQLFTDRYDRVTYCDIGVSAVVEGDNLTAIRVEPKSVEKKCKVPVTVPQDVHKADGEDANVTYEKRGKDRLVVWVSFEKGDTDAKTITLNPPLPWINASVVPFFEEGLEEEETGAAWLGDNEAEIENEAWFNDIEIEQEDEENNTKFDKAAEADVEPELDEDINAWFGTADGAEVEAPVELNEPAVVEAPAVEAPVEFNEPAVVEAPVELNEPAVVEAPVEFNEPAVEAPALEAPVEFNEPAVVEAPVELNEPAVEAPVEFNEPTVEAPVEFNEPTVIEAPTVVEAPAVVEAPVVEGPFEDQQEQQFVWFNGPEVNGPAEEGVLF